MSNIYKYFKILVTNIIYLKYIHTAGVTKDYTQMSNNRASQIDFTTSMAIAASAVANYFKIKRLLLILMF